MSSNMVERDFAKILDRYYQDCEQNPKNAPGPVEQQPAERAAGGRVVAANIEHNPSDAQKEAGNYRKDHINIHGLSFAIEVAKGHVRRGKDWEVTMPAHYGYIKRTEGADGDHVDCYLGPHLASKHVFIVNQVNPDTKKFDEHKVLLGFGNYVQAINTYVKGFSDGRGMQRLGSFVPMTIEEFKDWLTKENTKEPCLKP